MEIVLSKNKPNNSTRGLRLTASSTYEVLDLKRPRLTKSSTYNFLDLLSPRLTMSSTY